MQHFDLIPADYHQMLHRERAMHKSVIGLTGAVLLVLVAWLILFVLNRADAGEIERLTILREQSEQIQQLISNQQAALQRLTLERDGLAALRSGLPLGDALGVIDGELGDADIWFVNWRVVTGTDSGSDKHIAMSISGRAADHATLSEFVRRLAANGRVLQVRLERTRAETVNGQRVVGFNVSVSVDRREQQ